MARLKDSDLLASFLSSKVTVAAGVITVVLFLAALFAPWIAPTDPFNPATNFLSDSLDPPSFVAGGDPRFWLGTDDQGRDIGRRSSTGSAFRSRSGSAASCSAARSASGSA